MISYGYICGECARRHGGQWPEGHRGSAHEAQCPRCSQTRMLTSITDWAWPTVSALPDEQKAPDGMVTLAECPIGLFLTRGGELGVKTEYGGIRTPFDAYLVESGCFFWGSKPQTIENQSKQFVTPVENVTLAKLPVAFRIKVGHGWMIFQNEEAAQIEAEHRGVDYEGLYVRGGLPAT